MKNEGLAFLLFFVLLSSLTIPSSMQSTTTQDEPVKNVIIMIGDGMGWEHLKLGSYVEFGTPYDLFMQSSSFLKGNMSTYSANDEITDSAASATALATGYKTDNGKISLLPNGTSIETILEYAQKKELKTGLISTAYFYHATPAAFSSHEDSRYDYQQIIPKMLESDTDLILGGGLHLENLGPAIGYNQLINENNYTLIETKNELQTMSKDGKYMGNFGSGHIQWESELNVTTDVRLRHMTAAALDQLENENGFFLMVEGARIDHAGHDNNQVNNALEMIEFDNTVELVHDWVNDNPNTLVIVTGDHETGGLSVISANGLDEKLPIDTDSESTKQERRITRAGQMEVSYSTESHTGQDVPVFAFGRGSDSLFDTTQHDNTDMYSKMKNAIDGVNLVNSVTSTSQTPDNIKTPSRADDVPAFELLLILSSLIITSSLYKKKIKN